MTPRPFDRFMVDIHIGQNRKLRRLSPSERWCHVAGVLAIAAEAPIPGCLVVGELDAEPHDYAEHAGVTIATARSAVAKLRDLGVIEPDPENGCERVHDWHDYQPRPKRADPTNAARQARWRQRRDEKRQAAADGNNAERNASSNAPRNATVVTLGNAATVAGRNGASFSSLPVPSPSTTYREREGVG